MREHLCQTLTPEGTQKLQAAWTEMEAEDAATAHASAERVLNVADHIATELGKHPAPIPDAASVA